MKCYVLDEFRGNTPVSAQPRPRDTAIKLGLRNTELLLESLDNPHKQFASVQIAGTNGKGSTAVVLDSICRAAGIPTGVYTSPHLVSITERIRIGGSEISQEKFAMYASEVRAAADSLLARESWKLCQPSLNKSRRLHFLLSEKPVSGWLFWRLDWAAGWMRLPLPEQKLLPLRLWLSIIRSISERRSMKLLLRRLLLSGQGVTAIIAAQPAQALNVILRRCAEVEVEPSVEMDQSRNRIEQVTDDGRLVVTFETNEARYENVLLGLRGRHQIVNTSVAIRLAESLRKHGFEVSKAAIIEGIKTARHAGRLELHDGRPSWLFDGAHNPAGAQALREFLDEFVKRPVTLVFGAMNDKRLEEIATILFPAADRLILTQPDNPRAAEVGRLRSLAAGIVNGEKVTAARSVSEALQMAKDITPPHGLICVTGSLYLLGEVKAIKGI